MSQRLIQTDAGFLSTDFGQGESRKARQELTFWAKELSPSTALRKWFSHARERFEEFARRYREELTAIVEIAEELLSASRHCNRTALLYAAKDTECNHAIVLLDWLNSLDKNSESRDPRPSLE